MQLFKTQSQNLVELIEQPFRLEKEIQTLFEHNLEKITDLKLIKSEFTIKNHRIDTLAFDLESNAFVIIEYKRNQNYSVVDQGISYLNLMLEYKAEFILEYNESQNNTLKRQEIDWSQTRVIFIAPSFTYFQKQATNYKDLGIELWEIKHYQDGLLSLHQIQKTKSAPSFKQIQKAGSEKIQAITKEIIQYDEDYHLADKSYEIQELYEQFKNAILNLAPDLKIKSTKVYIAYKHNKYNIIDIKPMKNQIKIWLNLVKGQLDDAKKLAKDVSNIGHLGNRDYEIIITNDENLEYILSLIKQSLK